MDLALNNLQRLICHKPNNQPTNNIHFDCIMFHSVGLWGKVFTNSLRD